MSEEQTQDFNDGTWSGLKKTIVGTLGTVVAGGGVWLSTLLFGGGADEKVEQAPQPTTPNIIINNTQQQQQAPAEKTIVIKEVQSPSSAPKAETKPKPKKDDWTKEEPKW